MCKIRIIFILSLTAILAIGCTVIVKRDPDGVAISDQRSNTKEIIPKDNKAIIYVYRNEFLGSIMPMVVSFDGIVAGRTFGYSYFVFEVDPGQHVISSFSINISTLELSAEPRRIYFIWQEATFGWKGPGSLLHLVDANEGRLGIQNCKLYKSRVFLPEELKSYTEEMGETQQN